MTKFRCQKCNSEKELKEFTIKLEGGELITPQAFCEKCSEYMRGDNVCYGFGKALMRGGKARGKKDYN